MAGKDGRRKAAGGEISTLRLLHDMALALASVSDLEAALGIILDSALQVRGIDSGAIYMFDPRTGNLEIRASRGLSAGFAESIRSFPPESPQAATVKAGEFVYGSHKDMLDRDLIAGLASEGIRCIAVLPVMHAGEALAAVVISSHESDAIEGAERMKLESMAGQIGAVLSRLKAEGALRSSREEWKAIFKGLGHPTLVMDPENRIIAANPAVEKLLGMPESDLEGRKCFEIFHGPENAHPPMGCPFVSLLSSGNGRETVEMEMESLGRVFLVSCTPVFDARGGLQKIIHIATDITERKRAEVAVRDSLARFEAIVRHTPLVAIQGYDRKGVIRLWNPASEALYGFSAPEAVGRRIQDLLHTPGEAAGYEEFLAGIQASGRATEPREWRVRTRSGDDRVVYSTIFSVDSGNGESEFYCMDVDITERIRLEETLRINEDRYRSIAESAKAGIGITDPYENIVFANEAFARMLGYGREELAGVNLSALSDSTEFARFKSESEKRKTGASSLYETALRSKSGEIRHFLVSASPLVSREGDFLGTLGLIFDITDRKKTEEKLKETEEKLRFSQKLEAVGRLAGGIAHDFNNLLTVINGYGELALMQLGPGQEELHAHIEEIRGAGRRAMDLTGQLLAFSRKQVLNPRALNLTDLVSGMENMLGRFIREDVRLEVRGAPCLWSVYADPGRIEQVVMNLAVNARDAMPDGGVIGIETSNVVLDAANFGDREIVRPGEYVMLAVSDTGQGMTREVMDRIFEPFFTTKPSGRGTGLGLATVYGIVKQSGGYIRPESAPGKGSAFRVYLPRCTEEAPAPVPAPDESSAPGGSETILIVEDEDGIRRFTAEVLRRAGYIVFEASGGQEALELLADRCGETHLLLTDVVMPGMSGRVLAKRVPSLVPGIRILFMSGYSEEAVALKGEIEPGTRFLEKPFTAQRLLRAVRDVLDGGDAG